MSNTQGSGPRRSGQEPAAVRVAFGLGSNLGDRAGHLERGRAALRALATDLRCSRVYETAPVGAPGHPDQPDFLNLCCVGETALGARELLEALLAAERREGRDPEAREGPRTLDLDLLLHGDHRIAVPGLEVPHPRLADRAFVLAPLAELIPEARVPGTGRTVAELAARAGSDGIEPLGALDDLLGEDGI